MLIAKYNIYKYTITNRIIRTVRTPKRGRNPGVSREKLEGSVDHIDSSGSSVILASIAVCRITTIYFRVPSTVTCFS